jgi:hypothetical protein
MSDSGNSGIVAFLLVLLVSSGVGGATLLGSNPEPATTPQTLNTNTVPTPVPTPYIPDIFGDNKRTGDKSIMTLSYPYEPADGIAYIGIEQSDMSQSALTTWLNTTGKGIFIYAFFSGAPSTISLSAIKTLCDNGYAGGVLISFNPSVSGASIEQAILDGDWDSYFTTLANTFKNFPYPKFLAWGAEMNGSWEPYGANSATYKAAWVYVHDIFASVGADVAWVFQPNQPPSANLNYAYGGRDIIMNYYPGDAYVDWFSVSCHAASWIGFGASVTSVMNTMGLIDIAASKNKPFMFSESGASANWQTGTPSEADRANWLTGYFNYIIATPRVKAFVYYNFGTTGSLEKPLFDESSLLTAYKSGVANSKFVYGSSIEETQVATPTFNPAAGTYSATQNVAISTATDDATLYYTTDGSTPDSGDTEYTVAVAVASSTTLKAIGIKAGLDDSTVAVGAYVINPPPSVAAPIIVISHISRLMRD